MLFRMHAADQSTRSATSKRSTHDRKVVNCFYFAH